MLFGRHYVQPLFGIQFLFLMHQTQMVVDHYSEIS